MSAGRRRIAAWGLALLAVANAGIVVWLWGPGGIRDIHDTASLLTGLGRVSGLLAAYLVLLQLLLLARLPVLDRLVGFDRLVVWHRVGGFACVALLGAHVVLITAGYTIGDRISLADEIARLITGYPGVITAVAGLTLLVAVAVTSAVIVRRRLRYETWYFVHLYAYLGVALAFSHQLATGSDFVGEPVARAYWYGLYAVTLGAIVVFRLGVPLARTLRHRLRVARVVEEAPGFVSIEIEGVRLERLRARTGQFFTWRFLTRDRWWEAHPFSLSAAPDGRRLRITVKGVGDYTAALRAIPPGTPVIAEGPFGSFTTATRRRPRVALIAGGVGHHADPRAARGHARRPGRHRGRLPRAAGGRRDPARGAGRAGRPARRRHPLRGRRPPRRRLPVLRAPAAAGAGHRGAGRVRLRAAGDDGGDAREPRALGRAAAAHLHGAVRPLMRRALPALVVTVVAVVLLARFDTEPPVTLNPNSALRPIATPRAIERPTATPPPPGSTTGTGPVVATPFSVIQVRATLTKGRLTGVETIALSGDGPHTEALNARAEPILREEALRAGSADIDVVSGATSTSESWIESLRAAIREARRG